MGTQLSAMAPTSVHPVDYYLADVDGLFYDSSLGSTRFFKVAKVRVAKSLAVAKVFVIHDPSLPVKNFKDRLDQLKDQLKGNPNALPFCRVYLNEKCGLLVRQFAKYSLYDRLSTRPFLTFFEKKWIAYQLLKAMQWVHRQGLTHGDLKLENVLLTSYNWVLLADFAPFKPTKVLDCSSDFSFFFDTSRRRTCTLAPERFETEDEGLNYETDLPVTPQMDLFSLGCVLAELFADSSDFQLFDLTGLLALKSGKRTPQEIQDTLATVIPDVKIVELIMNLIELDPAMRNSTTQHIHELNHLVFPASFSQFFEYMVTLISLNPDGKICKLESDFDCVISQFARDEPQILILILSLITSSIRSLTHVHAKVTSLNLICKMVSLSPHLISLYTLDRLLPYVMYLMIDSSSARVRAASVHSLGNILSSVDSVDSSDTNVFTDFILPELVKTANDPSTLVRIALASELASLSKTAQRFISTALWSAETMKKSEETGLLKEFQEMISKLLTDSTHDVRRALLDSNVSALCAFLGRSKTHDVILSHIITFLNDKSDHELRACFFDNVVPIAAFIGPINSLVLRPLLQQGLWDADEYVIHRALTSFTTFTELNFLEHSLLLELASEAMPLLAHPSPWIRQALVAFIVILVSKLNLADAHCLLIPLIQPHLTREIHLITADLILEYLRKPIPRDSFEQLLNQPSQALVEQVLAMMKNSTQDRHPTFHAIIDPRANPQVVHLYSRLKESGLSHQHEKQLASMSSLFLKIYQNRQRSKLCKTVATSNDVFIRTRASVHVEPLVDQEKLVTTRIRSLTTVSSRNEEWKQAYNPSDLLLASPEDQSTAVGLMVPLAAEAIEEPESPCPPCCNEFRSLISHKKDQHELCLWASSGETRGDHLAHSPHKPRGCLIAHLHEHTKGVTRLVPISSAGLVASCSLDGSIRLWDIARMEQVKMAINKSSQCIQSRDLMGFECMTYCASLDVLIAASSGSLLQCYRVDTNSSRIQGEATAKLNHDITDLASAAPFTFLASFSNSKISGYDLRNDLNEAIYTLDVDPRDGFVTCVAGTEYCVFAATSSGSIYTFDTRFLVKANLVRYNESKRIRKILYSPSLGLFSSVKGNNEVTLFDCETGFRQKTLWASKSPILASSATSNSNSQDSVLSMIHLTHGSNESALITAGTDMRIRYWDLNVPERSYVISDGLKCSSSRAYSDRSFNYGSKLVEGIQVLVEEEQKTSNPTSDPLPVSTAHHDSISDLAYFDSIGVLVSASRDGLVKVWK